MYSFSDFSTLKDLPDVKDDISNNLIECFNKQFKAWYKTKQGFSSFESANNLISLFVFFFNFVRPHSALNGLTPAQVAGLNLSKRRKRESDLSDRGRRSCIYSRSRRNAYDEHGPAN